MKRIMIVMGTRPEAVKLCPLVRELKERGAHETLVLSTGQHRAMLDSALTQQPRKASGASAVWRQQSGQRRASMF